MWAPYWAHTLVELYAIELTMVSQQQLAHIPSSWLINQATSLSRHLVEQGFNTWHKSRSMWKASWGLSHRETHDDIKKNFDDIKEVIFC